MRQMKKTKKVLAVLTILMLSLLLVVHTVAALTDPPVTAKVTFSKTSYNLDDPDEQIGATITLANTSGTEVLVPDGFGEIWYHLYLYFQGPEADSPIITSNSSGAGSSPSPSVPPKKVRAEQLAADWVITMDLAEVREYYPLTKPGTYTVWFEIPYVRYDSTNAEGIDTDNDGVFDYYEVPYDPENPKAEVLSSGTIKSAVTYITLAAATTGVTSDIRVKATEYVFGDGTHPGVTKKPLTQIQIRLYENSAVEAAGISLVNHTTYSAIASNFLIPFTLARKTGTPGEYMFDDAKQGDYVVIAYANKLTGYKNLGRSVGVDNLNWGTGEISVNLILMADKNNKKSPGKSRKLTGSELLIIEPEYVEWTSDAELYPFAFESVGDWGVAVSVEPPEGFVADQEVLTEDVTHELEALQFTITDVGSKWKPTKVKYKVEHKGKTQHMESKINVKLSKKLAKKKGIGEWGEE
jgi:hypothetical protein